MKLRIKGNSIRCRLTQTEVTAIGEQQSVKEAVHFGSKYPAFVYMLHTAEDTEQLQVSYQEHCLCITLPRHQARSWALGEKVGIAEQIRLEDGNVLDVLIEKDFQCLHKRSGEDESDHFPNPALKTSS